MIRVAPRHVAALAGLALLFTLLLMPLPIFGSKFAVDLENFSHAPLFVLVSWGILRWLRAQFGAQPGARRYAQAALVAATFAMVTELVQPLTGRDDSLDDFYTDLAGTAAALLWLAAADPTVRARRLLLRAGALVAAAFVLWPLLFALAAYQHRLGIAPRLVDLGTERGRYFLQRQGVQWQPEPGGGWRVVSQQSRWPGLTLDEVLRDWRPYQALQVDVANPGDEPLNLLVRIDDRGPGTRYIDHFNASTVIAPGARVAWRIPLSGLTHRTAGRSLDITAMRRVILYQDTTRGTPALPYVLHDVRLLP